MNPAPGTIYLERRTGVVYRLRGYRVDRWAEPFTGRADVPEYMAHYRDGTSAPVQTLPRVAEAVWEPEVAR